MKNTIDILPDHLQIVKEILQRYFPVNTEVWAFGSRVTGKAKKYSDLDIAIDTELPLSVEVMANLTSEFEESSLPYKADVIDWRTIDKSFRDRICRDRILLWKSSTRRNGP